MSSLTFLTKEQLGSEILKKRGLGAVISDYSILSSGIVSRNDYLKERTGCYFLQTSDDSKYISVYFVDKDGNVISYNTSVLSNRIGGRICLSITEEVKKIILEKGIVAQDGVLELEYGYYPRSAASRYLQERLESLYKLCAIKESGFSFTRFCDGKKEVNPEYEYNGRRYVRTSSNILNREEVLSNGMKCVKGDYIWVEVEPVKWIVDEENELIITDEIIFSGIKFDGIDYKGDFDKSFVKKFIDEDLSRELFQTSFLVTEISDSLLLKEQEDILSFIFRTINDCNDVLSSSISLEQKVILVSEMLGNALESDIRGSIQRVRKI